MSRRDPDCILIPLSNPVGCCERVKLQEDMIIKGNVKICCCLFLIILFERENVRACWRVYYYCILLAHLSQTFQIDSKRRRADSFEAGCQWALINVLIIALLFYFYCTEVHVSSCQQSARWVFLCFRNPQDSDIDYRIFNVRT